MFIMKYYSKLCLWNLSNGKIEHRIEIGSNEVIENCFVASYLIVVSNNQIKESNIYTVRGYDINLKVCANLFFGKFFLRKLLISFAFLNRKTMVRVLDLRISKKY